MKAKLCKKAILAFFFPSPRHFDLITRPRLTVVLNSGTKYLGSADVQTSFNKCKQTNL